RRRRPRWATGCGRAGLPDRRDRLGGCRCGTVRSRVLLQWTRHQLIGVTNIGYTNITLLLGQPTIYLHCGTTMLAGSREIVCIDHRRIAIMTSMDEVHVEDPARVGITGLRDGRRLAWAEWGPTDGRPVLFCPGAGWGRRFGFGFGAAA